jgi:hypothetical protein
MEESNLSPFLPVINLNMVDLCRLSKKFSFLGTSAKTAKDSVRLWWGVSKLHDRV